MLKDILPRGLREGEEPRSGLAEGTLRTHSQSQGSAQREEVGVKGDARAAPSHELNKPEMIPARGPQTKFSYSFC